MRPCPSPLQTLEPSIFNSAHIDLPRKELLAQIRRETMKWLSAPDVPKVFVTLRAKDKARIGGRFYKLTAVEFSRAVTVLMDRLSRRYFKGREVRRGRKLRHAFVCEAGALVGLHYHGWIEVPARENGDFCEIVAAEWGKRAFADNADVKLVWSDGALSYSIKKKHTGHFFDHIDLENVSLA